MGIVLFEVVGQKTLQVPQYQDKEHTCRVCTYI